MAERKLPRLLKYILFGLGVFVMGVLLTLGGIAYAYRQSFYPGVKVATVTMAGHSQPEGTQAVGALVKQYLEHPIVVTVPKISEPRNEATGQYPDLEIPTTAASLGISFKQQEALDAAWQVGHQRNLWLWVKSVATTVFKGQAQPILYSIDQSQVTTFIHTKVTPQIATPAAAKVVIDGTTVSIADQKPGLTFDEAALTHELSLGLASSSDRDATYIHAPVTVTDSPIARAAVEPVAAQLDKLGNLKVTLSVEGTYLQPKRADLLTWFSPVQNDKGEIGLALSQEVISSYLDKNGSRNLDTQKSLTSVLGSLGAYAKPGVTDVQYAKSIYVALTNKPPVEVTPGQFTLGLFPGKYIMVDLAHQKMGLINGNTLEKTYVISSGKWSTPTPTTQNGEHFHIANKSSVAWSAEFGLYMPYWQNFVDDQGRLMPGDFGIHGLPYWPNGYKEGESDIGVPVSHGCVRLGAGADVYVYNWTEIGTPLIIQ